MLQFGLAQLAMRAWALKPEAQRAALVRDALRAGDTNLTQLFLDVRVALPPNARPHFDSLVDALAKWTPSESADVGADTHARR